MFSRIAFFLFSIGLAFSAAPLMAQDDDGPTLPEVVVEPEDNGETDGGDTDGGTLPPVTVTPDDGSNGGGTLPEVDVPADGGSPADDFNNFDPFDDNGLSDIFPGLSDLNTGGLDGGLRGGPMSVFDNPRAVDVVTQQQLTESAPTDIGAALENTVGVMVQRTGRGQSSPFVRGLTGQQVLIMVDGVRMTNATFRAGPNQYFNLIDPNSVERIEVIRGPGSVLYGGDAMGGVINVVTKSASITGYDFATGGTVQRFSTADLGYTGRLNVEGAIGSVGAYGGVGYGNYNNLDVAGNPDVPPFVVGRQQATSWAYNSADIKFNFCLSDCSELIVSVQHYRGEDIFRSDRFPANRESIFDPQTRDLYYIRWQGYNPCGLVSTYQITSSLHYFDETRIDRDFRAGRNPDLRSFRSFTDEQFGLTGSFTTDMCRLGTLSYGWDWYHDDIDSSRTDVDSSVAPPTVTPRAGEVPDDAFYSRYGVYLNWDMWLTDRLLASTGVRFEHVEAGATIDTVNANGDPVQGEIDPEYQDWIGHIGLTYEVSPCLHLIGSVSEGFRAPNIDDLASTNGNVFAGTQLPNPNLRPEHSYTYEVGVKFDDNCLRSQVFFWWTDLEDHILRGPPNANDFLSRANGRSELHGVEATAEYLLDCQWSLYGNFWYTYGQDEGLFDEPLSRIPPTQGIVGLRNRWCGGANWLDMYAWIVAEQDRLSARDIADVNRIPAGGTPGYYTLNVRYGRLISERQRLSVNVENLTDVQYRVHGSGSAGAGIGAVLTYEMLY